MSLYNDMQKVAISSTEVVLFRELEKAFLKLGYVHVDESHGTGHLVEFNNPLKQQQQIRCELCDLLIFVYNDKEARFTFLQNKKKYPPINAGHKKIYLPLRQKYLLGDFPCIKTTDNIPNNILSNRILDSIGSLGIFYLDGNNKINMDYCIMSLMTRISGPIPTWKDYDENRTRPFKFTGKSNTTRTVNGFSEVEGCDNLIEFEEYLLNMEIGEPFIPNSNDDNKKRYGYILNLIQSIVKKDESNQIETNSQSLKKIISDLNKIRNEYQLGKYINDSGSFPKFNIAIINTEKNKYQYIF